MREEKMVTERDLVLASREGYIAGAKAMCVRFNNGERMLYNHERDAAKLFPLPKRVVPRVLRDSTIDTGREFRLLNGEFQSRRLGGEWTTDGFDGWLLSVSVVRAFADLLAHPTEEIDDDGSDRDA